LGSEDWVTVVTRWLQPWNSFASLKGIRGSGEEACGWGSRELREGSTQD